MSILCIDRCPCHDKCSWGCPCGFYQCTHCDLISDEPHAKRCSDHCIAKADVYVEDCIAQQWEDDCYKTANQISIDCMKDCPCHENCRRCSDNCSEYCPDEPTNLDKCLEVWGEEEQACTEECDKPRKDCYSKCQTGACKDQCDIMWYPKEACCHRQCPCHSGCENGCPCAGDDCGYPEFNWENVNGGDFCQNPGPGPGFDKCIEDHLGDVRRCVQPCIDQSYVCAKSCHGDRFCIGKCQEAEEQCKAKCPCYANCPNGCPCPGYCGDRPCNTIWPDKIECCEDKCNNKRDMCYRNCQNNGGQRPELCEDDCNDDHSLCYKNCPCHSYCVNGCPCDGPNHSATPEETCCDSVDIDEPDDAECVILWEDEIRACRDHCSRVTQQCIYQCPEYDVNCRNQCYDNNARCIRQCPCYEDCPQGCPCVSLDENFPDFCSTVFPPPGSCRDQWQDEILKCYDHCYDKNYKCIRDCNGDPVCHDRCHREAVKCPEDCPCHENCPNGCPCGWEEVDCSEFRPYGEVEAEPRYDWCSDIIPPGEPQPDPHCEILWGDELQDCLGYCSLLEDSCADRCEGEKWCIDKCHRQRICCERDCPCHPNCIDGCPCPDWVEHDFCPDMIVDDDCMDDWWQEAKRCEYDCQNDAYQCLDNCYGNSYCYHDCHDKELLCLASCPCHENCRNGCDVGFCPSWDKYCKATTTMETTTTTARTTTIRTTTTTQDTGIGPGPTAPPIDEIEGDTILILAEDKAMLHNWPRGGGAKFNTLQNSYNDFNSKWEMNGYWVKDACSVQFQGESYLIGGAYNCDGGTANCEHVNIQKAVMKLSTTKCGLEIVWDGNDKALPFDMKEHSCAVYNKRINNNDFKPHVMLCSPDDTANDPHNDKEYIDKYCWR